jgi:protein TonB
MPARLSLALIAVAALVSTLGAQQPPAQSQTPPDDFLKGVYAADTKDLVKPKVIREVKPKYTVEAMRAKIQGTVKVQIVVATDGKVARARVLDGLYNELNVMALDAAKKWEFVPARLNGDAVPVAMELMLEFRLH